ncbi:MAG: class I SAM-dependent methyltransferase [Rhodobacteraceae bacterium]|nr:class I SAM-dependent methyltransferase [Paracoccaceae bacterium]
MTIVELFEGLDRAGPGDRESLERALAGVPPDARVLDAGCGRGADLPALLARVPRGRVVAVDRAPAFIAHVRAAFPRVRAEVADMLDPPGGPFDLIWCAGAICHAGVAPALAAWRRALAPGGRVAFSDLLLRVPDPAPALRDWLAGAGVALRDEAALRAEVAAAGFRVLDAFWISRAAWQACCGPLERRLDGLETSPLTRALRTEIALWRRHGEEFGYLLAVTEPSP